jgi:hypothetical protein
MTLWDVAADVRVIVLCPRGAELMANINAARDGHPELLPKSA